MQTVSCVATDGWCSHQVVTIWYGLNCVPPNPYVEALNSSVTELGNEAFRW